jgi:prepilin-type processing-associated H-X9-DG protein
VPIGGSYNGRDFGDTNYYNNIDTLPSLNNGFFDGHAYIMGQTGNLITPKSNQPGGVNMLFLDGSVKLIKSSVKPGTCGALGTMAGGEFVSSDSY